METIVLREDITLEGHDRFNGATLSRAWKKNELAGDLGRMLESLLQWSHAQPSVETRSKAVPLQQAEACFNGATLN